MLLKEKEVILKQSGKFENDILKTIYERRSVRKYKDISIERKIVEQLLDAGRMAPSAINKQPWRFYVLTNKDDINSFSKEISVAAAKGFVKFGIKKIVKTASDLLHFSHGIDFLKTKNYIFHGAPVVIFITSHIDDEWAALDIGMCSQNIMLAAKSMGLDSCPVGLAKFVEQTKMYSKLGVSKLEKVNLAIVLGYGDENPEPKDRVRNNSVFI